MSVLALMVIILFIIDQGQYLFVKFRIFTCLLYHIPHVSKRAT